MSDCATSCGRPTRDTLMLCEPCIGQLRVDLAELPDLLDDLATTLTRQARMTQRNGGKSAEHPVPFHVRAADVAAHARGVLVGWVRVLAGDDPDLYPADRIGAIVVWLGRRVDTMARHEAAGEMHSEITDTAARIRWVIDRPADRLYAGHCGAQYAEAAPPCAEPLYAHPGAAVVRCIDCGTVHDVAKRREDMLRRLDDRLVSASEFAHLATYLVADIGRSREQTRKLVNQWHKRGLLERKNHTGDPLFRFADAITVLARDEARRNERDQGKQTVPA